MVKDVNINDVGKVFGVGGSNPFTALENVSLDVNAGEFLSLLGPSGCGKSTLLRMVAGLEHPITGSISVGGGKVKTGFENIGLVFQRPNLLPWLSIIDNVQYPARVKFANAQISIAVAPMSFWNKSAFHTCQRRCQTVCRVVCNNVPRSHAVWQWTRT